LRREFRRKKLAEAAQLEFLASIEISFKTIFNLSALNPNNTPASQGPLP
jgi:hypothetical protein